MPESYPLCHLQAPGPAVLREARGVITTRYKNKSKVAVFTSLKLMSLQIHGSLPPLYVVNVQTQSCVNLPGWLILQIILLLARLLAKLPSKVFRGRVLKMSGAVRKHGSVHSGARAS